MLLASEEAHAGALSRVLGASYVSGETDEANTAPLPQETKGGGKETVY